jgi:putative NADH-flavin reductase
VVVVLDTAFRRGIAYGREALGTAMAARKAPKKAARPARSARSPRPAKRPARAPKKAVARKAPKKAVRKAARPAAKKVPKRASKPAVRKAAARPPAKKAAAPAKAKPAVRTAAARPAPAAPEVEFREVVKPLRVALFGASGRIGSRIAQEALARGHQVTAAMRHPEKLQLRHPNLRAVRADASDPLMVRAVAKGHDVVAAAVAPRLESPDELSDAAVALTQGTREANVPRLLWVGGAGSLQVPGGKQLLDSPSFPAEWRPLALAHRDAMQVLAERAGDLQWTCISPPAMVEPGKRTGKYRAGTDQLLADAKGESRISMEDYAVAFVDEMERPRNPRRRMTVAY